MMTVVSLFFSFQAINPAYCLYYDMGAEVKAKVRLIREINTALTLFGKQAISPEDFDILYDMSLEELTQAKREIHKKLRTIAMEQ